MSKAAVVLDDWKLDTFKEILDAEGYKYEQFNGPLAGCITLTVITDDLPKLGKVITRMEETAKSRRLN
jgi:hypothetical protein